MIEKWSHKSIIGYTDDETVMLDFDNTTFKTVRYWASKVKKKFRLGGFIILKSSKDCYHIVFDRKVSWRENVRIMAWVCLLSKHMKVTGWFILQCIKEGSTLRVSPKREKPSPRIVFRCGEENGQIESFLKYRKLIKNIIRKLKAD